MNAETAKHLNALLDRTRNPLQLTQDKSSAYPAYRVTGGTADERQKLDDFIEAARVRVESEAIHREIMSAAGERRIADTYTGGRDESLLYWGQVNGHYKGAGGIALSLVINDVRTEVARMNKFADDMYAAYRRAAEQGIAMPVVRGPGVA